MSNEKSKSFADIVQSSRADCIYLVRGNDSTGRAAWYYVMVDKLKKRIFESDAKKGQIQLTDYGKIIISGYGEEAPNSVKQRMKDEYGFEE
jgi:hypothetical protein